MDVVKFIESIPAQDLARATHRNGGSAKRDQQSLIVLYEKLEQRFAMLGLKITVETMVDSVKERNRKFQAWSELYGHQQNPEVDWPEFASKYAYSQDIDGNWQAFKL